MEKFTFAYLETTFQTRHGPGATTLVIDGIEVTKSLVPRRSNSRKSLSWDVTFTFKDAGGMFQRVERQGRFALNRANDPNRNWGLHE